MRDVDARTVTWLGGVIDLMREPTVEMPVRPLLAQMYETFACCGVSWNWAETDGSFGMIMEPADAFIGEQDTLDAWLTGELLDCHALISWFALTNDPAPYTTARVPTSVVPRRRRLLVERPLMRMGMEHQLSIPYRMNGPQVYAFVFARGSRDFDDDDLTVAGVVQRSLRSLDQQHQALARLVTAAGSVVVGSDLGLSGRELAVLQLLTDGDSTRAIARRLACAPRTVEKHLERCFRKLGVRDRLNAVRVGRLAGILGTSAPVRPERAALGPGAYRGPVPSPPRT